MWNNKTVAVIFPAQGEKRSIKSVIQEFDASGYVDEIIVVENNADNGIAEEVKKTRARIVKETQAGYGAAVRAGIKSTQADLLIISEPDGTFSGGDIVKFLSYSDDFDLVFGSRTHIPLIQKKSEMTFWKRIYDVLFGKLISLLFICPPLTDVGCTFRLTNRKAWLKVAKDARSDSRLFAAEWLLFAAKNKVKFIQIPVNYRARVGNNGSLTVSFWNQLLWVVTIFFCILIVRIRPGTEKLSRELNPRYS